MDMFGHCFIFLFFTIVIAEGIVSSQGQRNYEPLIMSTLPIIKQALEV
jgi:hypothetical protein